MQHKMNKYIKKIFSDSGCCTVFFAFSWLLISGCSALNSNLNDANVSYLETARKNFEAGEKALADKRYDEAVSYFEHVRSKFPYSHVAVLSDFKIGDVYFEEEKWLEAADAYSFFVRFHPRHEQVPNSKFRIAQSNFNAIPSDFFLFPKSFTRDQGSTTEALDAANDLIQNFPEHERFNEALQMKRELLSKLAARDMEIARFYARLKKWRGAMGRYERVASLYSSTEFAPEALYESEIIAREHLKLSQKATSLYEKLQERYPGSAFAMHTKSVPEKS